MPRNSIELEHPVEYLSILNKDGELDEELEPDIPDDLLLRLHRTMLLGRRFDERLLQLQRQGRIGTFAPIKGQEAAHIGAVAALQEQDWFVPSFRETGAALWRGTPMTGILLYNAGFNEGGSIPEDQHDLPIAVPVGSQLPHAVGLAYGAKYRETEEIAIAFFGDGGTSEGDFHEALNFAAVFQAPVIFFCQNNQWAISVPRDRQTRSKTLAQKALAYGMPGIQVDGNDVLAVFAATREAAERARSGEGPTLIEAVTYRLSVHTTADDPSRYREDKEVKKWEKRDPISRFQTYLMNKDLLSEDKIEEIEKEVKKEIEAAWEEASQQMDKLGDPLVMFEHVYAEMPAYLREQRDSFEKFLKAQEAEHG